jgi:hypothetical protein
LGSQYNKISENSEEKEVQRRKEVDDLISKYASKKKVSATQNDFSATSLANNNNSATANSGGNDFATSRFGSLRDNLYGGPSRDNLYGGASRDNLYGGASRDNLYGGASRDNLYGTASRDNIYGTTSRRRSSQYDTLADTTATTPSSAYTSANLYGRSNDFNNTTATAPRRYLATSKSSTNIYLHPNTSGSGYDFGAKNIPEPSRIQTRQQKTLSMHGLPTLPTLPSPSVQQRMSGILPSSSLSSFQHLASQHQAAPDWGWSGQGGSLLNHHPYHSAGEPVSAPVSKGLGFWTNPSSLIPVTKRCSGLPVFAWIDFFPALLSKRSIESFFPLFGFFVGPKSKECLLRSHLTGHEFHKKRKKKFAALLLNVVAFKAHSSVFYVIAETDSTKLFYNRINFSPICPFRAGRPFRTTRTATCRTSSATSSRTTRTDVNVILERVDFHG